MSSGDTVVDRQRRREADNLVGQLRALWPVLTALGSVVIAVAVGYAAWEGVRVKTAENAVDIDKVEARVSSVENVMAAQTAILARVEASVSSIDRSLRRRSREPIE